MPEYTEADNKYFSKGRLESLSDGIFAIVMTIIVLELKIPDNIPHELVETQLPLEFKKMLPALETYFVSFFLLGLFWMRHVTQYRYIKQVDRTLMWINITFLMFVALIPFSTNLLMDYPDETAFLVYSINLAAIGYTLLIHWSYASYRKLLADEAVPGIIKDLRMFTLITSALFTACIIVSFYDVRTGIFMLYLDPVFYMAYFIYRKRRTGHFLTLSKYRVETLCDGIFAIVMTLMILSLAIPENIPPEIAKTEIPQRLIGLIPKFENYFLSFIVLGIYWVRHQRQFKYINESDRMLLWINVLFLVFVTIIPFTTDLMMAYPDHSLPIKLYCINLFITGIIIYFHWRYAAFSHRLVDASLDQGFIKRSSLIILIGPATFLLCLLAAFYDVRVALTMVYLVPVLTVIFRNYDRMSTLGSKITGKFRRKKA